MKKILFITYLFIYTCFLYASEIKYYTTGHDAFTGWDIYQNKLISFGIPNDMNSIAGYQHKIHDANGSFTDNLEFFCDPDDIIHIESDFGRQIKYISYLPMKKDIFLNNKKDFFRVSYLTQIELINDLRKEPILIRIDKSLKTKDNYIDNRIYLKNKSLSKINITWIAQDAAYMSFIDNNQNNVIPYSKIKNTIIKKNFFSKINIGDKIGTKHTRESITASYSPINIPNKCEIFGGVINEYAFFKGHSMKNLTKLQYPYGYADVSKSNYRSIADLKYYFIHRKYNTSGLQNRMLLYECKNISPGEEIVIHYKQIGDFLNE